MNVPLACCMAVLAASESGPRPLSLREAIASAIERNPQISSSRGRVGLAEGQAQERGGLFSPRLTGRVSYGSYRLLVGAEPLDFVEETVAFDLGVSGVTPLGTHYLLGLHADYFRTNSALATLSPAYRTGPTLVVAQPLLRGFGPSVNLGPINSAANAVTSADEGLHATMLAVAAETVERYWNWAVQREEVKINEGLLEQAREQLRKTQLRAKAGAISPLEVSQAEATVAQRDDDLRSRQRDVIVAERDLLLIAFLQEQPGFAWEHGYIPADAPTRLTEVPLLSAVVEAALKHRPEIRQAESAVSEQVLAVKVVEDTLLPRLDLTLKVGATGLAGNSTGVVTTSPRLAPGNFGTAAANLTSAPFYEFGLEGELPLWRDTQKGQVRKAQAELSIREAAVQMRKAEVVLEARALVLQLKADVGRVEAAGEALRLAEINLDAEQRKFNGGIATTFDVLRVQGELARAKSNGIKALANLNVSMARLDRARGTLLKRYGLEK